MLQNTQGAPKDLFYNKEFPKQSQPAPGLQQKMQPVPDCGETSYKGSGKLTGRRALVTGGDSGIGRAAAIAFAREGADVAINYLPAEEADAQQVKEYIEKAGQKAALLPCDLRDEQATRKMVDMAAAQLGGLDILVLNAGMQQAAEDITQITTEQIKATFETNIISMYYTVQQALQYMGEGSSIITTTSVEAYDPSPTLIDYAATKGAIRVFTECLAKQMSKKGIRVNAVAPGPVWTPLQIAGGQLPDSVPKFGQSSLIGRAGEPAELADVYVLLASGSSSYTTGQVYGVTGGKLTN